MEGSGSGGGSDDVGSHIPNQDALNEMRRRENSYRNSNVDCSEIAEDLFEASGRKGEIIEIRAGNEPINTGNNMFDEIRWGNEALHVEQLGEIRNFGYHTVFSDGRFIFDPRFSSNPILRADYFNMIKRLNPNGINITITHP